MQSTDHPSPAAGVADSSRDADGRTRTEGLVDRIRSDIAANRYAPGVRLTEKGLAETYGTSRTPVREAARALVQESLLEYVPNWGYRVARLRMRDLDDLYAIRLAVEQQSVRRLADGLGDLTVLGDLLEEWTAPPPPAPSANLVFADESFHERLAEAADGAVLVDTLRSINRRIHALRLREFVDADRIVRTYDQHAGILRAIVDGDPVLATALMTSHILEGQRFVRANAVAQGLIDFEPTSREVDA